MKRPSHWSLPAAVVFWVVAATTVTAALTAIFSRLFFSKWAPWDVNDASLKLTDTTKYAIAVVAGIAGVQALVVGYRKQRASESDESERTGRFGAAAEQMGSPEATVRLAGAFAMAYLGDGWPNQRQQCLDVLTGYLRLPAFQDPNGEHGTEDRSEIEIRRAIGKILTDRLRPSAPVSWSPLHFDLSNSALAEISFKDCVFEKWADFAGATFNSKANFQGVRFRAGARFAGATFSTDAVFAGAQFGGAAGFSETRFEGRANFNTTRFEAGAWFVRAIANEGVDFSKAKFKGVVSFDHCVVRLLCQFTESTFRDGLYFRYLKLQTTDFSHASFSGGSRFRKTEFRGKTTFADATFKQNAEFERSEFLSLARFERTSFERCSFKECFFKSRAWFTQSEPAKAVREALELRSEKSTGRIEFEAP